MGGVIYILRHGATKLNNQTDMSEDRIRGWTDVPLAEEGRKEAEAAGLKLKPKGVQAIVTSDLSRAKETAAIIGKILGVKPAVSRGLRPWNLGTFAGKSSKEAMPAIAQYVQEKPDTAVPDGESFNAFKMRAFEGLADAIEANHGKVLVIVTHHRNERLYEAWGKAGRPEDLSIDLKEFLQKGDPPGGIKELAIGDVEKWEPSSDSGLTGSSQPANSNSGPARSNVALTVPPAKRLGNGLITDADGRGATSASPAGKNGPNMPNPSETRATKADAHYGLAKAGSADRCDTCKSFRPPNDCVKVVPPIASAGWCRLGHSKVDGHAYYGDPAEEASESPAEAAAEGDTGEEAEPQPRSAMNPETMAHGRAIAGAKALHAVGHISEKQRDKHIGVSRAAIAKAALFGRRA